MMARRALPTVVHALSRQAAVVLIGPRQVGKTTLALAIAQTRPSLYLDLEDREDRSKLADPALLLGRGRSAGQGVGRFLLLGSASLDLRLVKSPKTYVRDSGLLHTLLAIPDCSALAGHPVAGMSWEGFGIETLLAAASSQTRFSFYRTAAEDEIDLLLELPDGALWAVEIKLGLAPRLERGFHHARADLQPARCFVVYSGTASYPLAEGIEAISLRALAELLSSLPS